MIKSRVDLTRTVLFYGPPGTGKTLAVRAVAHETASMIFDLSPLAIEGTYQEKKGEEKLVASVMKVAKHYEPAVVYIDECEKTFPGKKKGKKGKKKGKKGKKGKDPNSPSRIKKALLSWKKGFLKDDTRVIIVGCSSEPHEGAKKDMKSFWDKHIFFPFPDYSTRRVMWQRFIETKYGGKLKPDFPLSTLALISLGYSAGSVMQACERVLTEYRKEQLETRPLTLSEFIGPLSLTHLTMDTLYDAYRDFTDHVSGDKLRRKRIEDAQKEDGDDKGKKKGKKGGKKKK